MQQFTALDFPNTLFQQNKQSRCSYPWETTLPGGGFFVSMDELGPKKTVPYLPDRLKKKGYVYEYAKLNNEVFQGRKVTGYLFRRMA